MKLNATRRQSKPERPETTFQPNFQQNYYSNAGYYDPNAVGPQLFDDTSAFNAYPTQQEGYFAQQQPMYAQNPAYNYYEPKPDFGGATSFLNKQMLDAGSMILQNQMSAAAGYYTEEVAKTSSTWFGNLKYYFAVDTGYVLKKLLLLFFPFAHKEWSVRYNPQEAIAPKDDVNAPDLYIPTMAYVTYILVAGYLLGVGDRFSPEQLGIQASAALAWLLIEVTIIFFACYLMNITSTLGFFSLLSYCSYKFVCMIVAMLVSLLFYELGYYAALGYSTLSLGYFLLRTLNLATQTNQHDAYSAPVRSNLTLVVVVCVAQPLVMYLLTRHLILRSSVQ